MAGFCIMNQLRVLLLPPGWDASPSILIHLAWLKRDHVELSLLSKETSQWQGLGLESPTFRSEVQRVTAPP